MKYDFEIKTDPKYLAAAVSGEKSFTVRKNDRPYKVGSVIRKVGFSSENGYTGEYADFKITYILTSTQFPQGIKEGYVVLGISRVETIVIDNNLIRQVIDCLNEVAGTKYRYDTRSSKRVIMARVNEGYQYEDFEKVIKSKYQDWKETSMEKYLRPETLFGTKFESYLNAKINSNNRPKSESFSQERHYSKEEMDKIWPVATAEDYKTLLD